MKNGPSMAGLGLGGEGYLSFSIATLTGEGVTNPRTFTRVALCDGRQPGDDMRLARVEGNIVVTRTPSLDGWRLVVCQPINLEGEDDGTPVASTLTGPHAPTVIVSSDGLVARKAVVDNRSLARR